MKSHEPTTYSVLRRLTGAAALLFLATNAAKALDYASTITNDNPSAYYRFEETSGLTAYDSSTNDVPATINLNGEGTSPALGLPGIDTNSYYFSVPSIPAPGNIESDYGYVDIPNSEFIQPLAADGTNSAAFSAELWVQPTQENSTWEVPIEVAAWPYGWNFYVSGADVAGPSYFYLNMPNGVAFDQLGSAPVTFLSWYHLVLTYDGTNGIVYLNGQVVDSRPLSYAPALNQDAHVGSGQGIGWAPFIGGIDEVAFYDYVLSASQVTNHYAIGTNSFRLGNIPAGISSAPDSETNYSGLPVTFLVTPSGSAPFTYYWYSNSVPVGPDANALTFTAAYPANNNANIYVVVSNFYGAQTSSVVTLTVLTNLNLVSAPISLTRNVGSYAAFHVTADGAVPITYQWSVSTNSGSTFNAITGATNESLWLSSVQMPENGNIYSVLVSNPFTSSTPTATLAVQARTDPPVSLHGYGAIVAADNPVAYWRLNETSGTLAEDAVGTFDGTYTPGTGSVTYGLPTGIPHDLETGVSLTNGATVQVPWAPELNPDTAWSVETWFNPSVVGDTYRILLCSEYNAYPSPYNGWYIYEQQNYGSGSTIAFVPQPGNDFITAPNQLQAGTWYYLAITDDTTNFNVYINGQVEATASAIGALTFIPNGDGINLDGTAGNTNGPDAAADNANFVIGQRDDLAWGVYEGTINDTAVYQYALSPQQILSHYNDAPTFSIAQSGTSLTLTWSAGQLQSTTDLTVPFAPVVATSPYTTSTTSGAAAVFYRVYVP
jgi:hypothetical protein